MLAGGGSFRFGVIGGGMTGASMIRSELDTVDSDNDFSLFSPPVSMSAIVAPISAISAVVDGGASSG